MNIYTSIIIFLLIFYLDYKLCDILPGNISGGRRQLFCNYPIIFLVFYIFYFFLLFRSHNKN
jgi:hypothetical protein